jgi:3-deoxy-D-manno-octulosonate 8-phosphate phosphatase (KDO 8-P phosphatase)
LVVDVDGVLTDGVIAIDDLGIETKHFSVRDGSGISLWRKSGRRIAILSGRRARCVDRRAAELGIDPVVQGSTAKGKDLRKIANDLDESLEATLYMGDDWPDLPAIACAGLAACPADAAPEVRQAVHLITSSTGGSGAVREMIIRILQECGEYERLIAAFQDAA